MMWLIPVFKGIFLGLTSRGASRSIYLDCYIPTPYVEYLCAPYGGVLACRAIFSWMVIQWPTTLGTTRILSWWHDIHQMSRCWCCSLIGVPGYKQVPRMTARTVYSTSQITMLDEEDKCRRRYTEDCTDGHNTSIQVDKQYSSDWQGGNWNM